MTADGPEITEDCLPFVDAIAAMTQDAFARAYGNGDGEAALIAALRAANDVVVELAALEQGALAGHILFSRMADEPFTGRIAGLAPMCVRGDRQRSGIGSALVRAGLSRCRDRGIRAVMVLGENDYYGRFGFEARLAEGIACPYAGPHFQALELEPGALAGTRSANYARAFAAARAGG